MLCIRQQHCPRYQMNWPIKRRLTRNVPSMCLLYCIVVMDLIYLKIVLLLNGWVFARGAPVAMLQHATSSQSFVFHSATTESSASIPISSALERQNARQPKYEYKYEVSDHQTGDRKSHWESREGDKVRGVYTLYEPDGALRTVEYTADALHGFNAVVKRNEATKHQYSNRNHNHGLNIKDDSQGYSNPYIQNRNKDTLYGPDVGFSVNHAAKFENAGNNF